MPIPIELLKKVSVVYVHGHCPDGLASAMILRHAFSMLGKKPQIEFLVHGTPEHRSAGLKRLDSPVALFCDIAPHPDFDEPVTLFDGTVKPAVGGRLAVYLAMEENRPIVLDHHVGARAIVEAFGDRGVYADEKEPGVSGAVLAFREVWEPICLYANPAFHRHAGRYSIEQFARCIGARDTWRTDSPDFILGQWASKLIMSKPASYWVEGTTSKASFGLPFLDPTQLEIGRALFEAHEESVRQAVEQCVFYVVPNEKGAQRSLGLERPVGLSVFQEQASGFRLCSDVAESLRAENAAEQRSMLAHQHPVDVVAGFSYVVDNPGEDPRLLYSLRGLGGFDVCRFAKDNGGGGHKAAAGFSVPYGEVATIAGDSPYNYIKRRLLEHLERIHVPQLDR